MRTTPKPLIFKDEFERAYYKILDSQRLGVSISGKTTISIDVPNLITALALIEDYELIGAKIIMTPERYKDIKKIPNPISLYINKALQNKSDDIINGILSIKEK